MVDALAGRDLQPSDIAIIREVYDSENAHETFELELERALDACCSIIVVEPSRLGDETARWISVGNCLHKTAVLAGVFSLGSGLIWNERPYVCTSFAVLSLLCTGLYTISWQFDPCCQYQVERDTESLAKYVLLRASPVVLVRRDNSRRKILHASMSLLATVFCAWKIYDTYK